MTTRCNRPSRPFHRFIAGRTKTTTIVAIVLTLSLALFALQSSALIEWLRHYDAGPTDKLRLAAYEGDVGALEWIAHDKGFFRQVGLNVDIVGYASGADAMGALRAGKADVATASDYVAVTHSFDESDLRILASIAHYANKGIVARRDHGIRTPNDLKGKRIGVTSPSGAEYSLHIFLALHGLNLGDVEIVALSPPQLIEALKEGRIDAACTWQPHIHTLKTALAERAVTFRGDGIGSYLLLIATEAQTTNSIALQKLLRALTLAEDWLRANPDAARQYIAMRFKLDPSHVDELWPTMALEIKLPQELLTALDGEARWLHKHLRKTTPGIPNYSNFISPDALKSVKPAAVTLFAAAKPPR